MSKKMTDKNKEAIERLNLMQERCCNGYDAEAINFAIKAIRIVEVIENCFIHNRGEGLIDLDDWKDIKKFVENEAESEDH